MVVLIACASGQGLTPTVTIAQTSRVETIRAAHQTAVPVEFHLEITNSLDHPVTLVGVELETVGESGGYAMQRVRHKFAKVIPARAKESIDLRAWVRPMQETDTGRIVTAVMIRGTARFESMGSTIQSAFTGRLAQ